MADLKVTLRGTGRYEVPATLLKFSLQLGNSGEFSPECLTRALLVLLA